MAKQGPDDDQNLFVLSEEDAKTFRAMAADYRRRMQAGTGGFGRGGRVVPQVPPPDPPPPPWGFVVLTPPGGIPAMWEETATGGGTGSGTQGDTMPGTGTGTAIDDQGDRPGFADCYVCQLMPMTPKGRALSHPRMNVDMLDTIRVYNPSFTAIKQGIFLPVLRDPWGYWWPAEGGTGASAGGLWVRLTAKSYGVGAFIQYTGEAVTDGTSPTAITWTDGTGGLTLYEVNDIDVPVATTETPGTGTGTHTSQDEHPTIVWAWPGTGGGYYLFDSQPRWEIVEITGGIDSATYTGELKGYDQNTGQLFRVEDVIIIDANALS